MTGDWFGEWLTGTACVVDSDIECTPIQFVVVEKLGLWRNRSMQLHCGFLHISSLGNMIILCEYDGIQSKLEQM